MCFVFFRSDLDIFFLFFQTFDSLSSSSLSSFFDDISYSIFFIAIKWKQKLNPKMFFMLIKTNISLESENSVYIHYVFLSSFICVCSCVEMVLPRLQKTTLNIVNLSIVCVLSWSNNVRNKNTHKFHFPKRFPWAIMMSENCMLSLFHILIRYKDGKWGPKKEK